MKKIVMMILAILVGSFQVNMALASIIPGYTVTHTSFSDQASADAWADQLIANVKADIAGYAATGILISQNDVLLTKSIDPESFQQCHGGPVGPVMPGPCSAGVTRFFPSFTIELTNPNFTLNQVFFDGPAGLNCLQALNLAKTQEMVVWVIDQAQTDTDGGCGLDLVTIYNR